MALLVGTTNLFFWCFFGKLTSESYARIADYLYESNWQDLPVELRKYFILLIANAQRPIFYHGFGIAVLNLETFCKVWWNLNYHY